MPLRLLALIQLLSLDEGEGDAEPEAPAGSQVEPR